MNRVLYVAETGSQTNAFVYGVPVCVFNLRGREPDPRLGALRAERYKAWLRLRATLRGSGARKEDRWKAFQGLLPAIQALIQQNPSGPPKAIIEKGVVGSTPGPWAVWETSFRSGDGSAEAKFIQESNATDTPEKAYEYWTKTMLQRSKLVEYRKEPAILCGGNGTLSPLEVAHYVWAIVGGIQKVCLTCHKTFLCHRKDNQYCSLRCKWAKRKANQRAKRKPETKDCPQPNTKLVHCKTATK